MMNSKEIFKKVGGIIAELTEQYQYLSDNTDEVNDLELELFLANSNFLSDHIEILRKINSKKSGVETDIKVQSQVDKVEPGKDNDHSEKPSGVENPQIDRPSDKTIEKEPIRNEETEATENSRPETEDKTNPPAEEQKPVSEPKEEKSEPVVEEETTPSSEAQPVPEKQTEEPEEAAIKSENNQAPETSNDNKPAETIADETTSHTVVQSEKTIAIPQEELTNARPTLNDMLAKPASDTSRFNQAPPADLKSSISLNDKLLFVKDLFNGYSLAYSEAIELLNRFDSFESAENFLKVNYSVKNNWAEKQQTADKFYEILARKFSR